jgi:sugar phosphate isomerase/epimerase
MELSIYVMTNYHNFYPGADYGLDPKKDDSHIDLDYKFPASHFALPTDPRTANQLKAVSDKLRTGAKTIEVSGITPQVLESIPEQHLKEINRLNKLAGAELTFHGPLLEPTGLTNEGWSEASRNQVEKQMWSSIERGQKMDPEGNLIITFHSSNGLPDPETITKDETGKIETKSLVVINERTGNITNIKKAKGDFLSGKPNADVYQHLKNINAEQWRGNLSNISITNHRIFEALNSIKKLGEGAAEFLKKEAAGEQIINPELESEGINSKEFSSNLDYAKIIMRDSYSQFKEAFNQAYETASDKEKRKLADFKEKHSAEIENYNVNKIDNVIKLNETVSEGVKLLDGIVTPESFKPLKEFAIDKASDTFSNLALQSFKKFKENAPIISIENPPAGSGLSSGDDLKELVKESRKKFVKSAVKSGMSESQAEKQAEKLIGVTWDVGHINMIRKYGFDKNDLIKQTEKIAPFIKHIHLSDNFGLDHTELPMGMGNVPTKELLNILQKRNKKLKKVVETGTWFEPFQTTPFRETLQAFGSSLGGETMAGTYWNSAPSPGSGGYFSGYGTMLPEQHFDTYGAGFSNLPTELGGQIAGKSRFSGAPIE